MADLDTLRTKVDEQASRYETIILYKNEWRLLSAALDRLDKATELLESVAPLSDENSPIRNWLAHP